MAIPANMLTDRISPRARSSRFSTLAAATDKIVISRNVLVGLCLTTFAFGILTTLAVDHMHARAGEAPAGREPEPVVLQTTPIEPPAKPAPVAAVPAPVAAVPAPPPSSSPAVLPQAAASEAVVVQLPPIAEKPADKSAGKLLARLPPSPSRGARPIAAGPVRATAVASHKRTSATVHRDSSSGATEAAPDEAPARPAPSKKKWVDPFGE